jgi:hypothetical protein
MYDMYVFLSDHQNEKLRLTIERLAGCGLGVETENSLAQY